MRRIFLISSLSIISGLTILIYFHNGWHTWLLIALLIPIILIGFIDYWHKTDNIKRQYPLFGRLSRIIEEQRHVLQEILIQNSTEGRPFTWLQRKIVYKRAADEQMHFPFGTELEYDKKDKIWYKHSAFPLEKNKDDIRITIGSAHCCKPYSCSIFNIAGMSFGSISSNATLALNGGAAIGNFAQNTGEGGLTPYHERYNADLIFQFGTGYFGCRDENGNFDEQKFRSVATKASVKMIEIKISQGAKPGFGAILPAKKNTEEIAKYRNVEAHKEIHSPSYHSAFSNEDELVKFIKKLRKLSEGKPIGIKICLGKEIELRSIIQSFKNENEYLDFIAIDGGEGGTGAGSIDAIHYVGMPLAKAVQITSRIFKEEGIRDQTKIIASGKIISSFDIIKMKALGADACYSARGMMFALGCVQSLKCNKNTCPTGITTMNSSRVRALNEDDKKVKVANYHRNTIQGVQELLAAAKLNSFEEITQDLIENLNENNTH